MVGCTESLRGTTILQWNQGTCPRDGSITINATGAEAGESNPWMLETAYDAFTERVKVLSDLEVKDDEENNLDQIKRMRGETPQPRRPWGATGASSSGVGGAPKHAGVSGGVGRPKRIYIFDPSRPIGLHLSARALTVEQVDSGGQGGAVRVGWQLALVDGDAQSHVHPRLGACIQALADLLSRSTVVSNLKTPAPKPCFATWTPPCPQFSSAGSAPSFVLSSGPGRRRGSDFSNAAEPCFP